MAKATFRIWRGNADGAQFVDYDTEVSEGMVVLDAVHRIPKPNRQTTWLSDGTVRPENAVPVPPKSMGNRN